MSNKDHEQVSIYPFSDEKREELSNQGARVRIQLDNPRRLGRWRDPCICLA